MSKASVDCLRILPVVSRVYTTDQLNEFFNELTHEWVNRNVKYPDINNLKATQNNLIFILNSKISHRSEVEYQVEKNGKIIVPWRQNEFDNNFVWLKNLPHGKYKLKIRYTVQREHVGECEFIIRPAWYQTTTAIIISGSLLAVFFGLIVVVIILFRKNRRSAIETEKQKQLQMELQVIRSQLNPHFIFNSLSSIQSLINKQDITGANEYLTEFSMMLRNTLSNAEMEQLPLEKEIKILETYLNLEQFRFSFNYKIDVDKNINRYETEIPSLLLQPLIENAVKHGISALKNTGELLLSFKRSRADMLVIVFDNGKGTQSNGYGLKLTRKRIQLLNNVFKDNNIELNIISDGKSYSEIINKAHVKSMVKEMGGYILMMDNKQIPVSRNRKELVKKFIETY